MISASYDMDEDNAVNDEESIFLSSSDDDDDQRLMSTRRNTPKNQAIKKSTRYSPMLNDGEYQVEDNDADDDIEEVEDDDDDDVMNGDMVRLAGSSAVLYDDNLNEVSPEEDEEYEEYNETLPANYKYTPTISYEDDDDHLEDVSDDEEHGSKSATKPTQMFDEYDPENIDNFDESRDILRKYQAAKAKLNEISAKETMIDSDGENDEKENEDSDEEKSKKGPKREEKVVVEAKREARPRRNIHKPQKLAEVVENKVKRKYKPRGEKASVIKVEEKVEVERKVVKKRSKSEDVVKPVVIKPVVMKPVVIKPVVIEPVVEPVVKRSPGRSEAGRKKRDKPLSREFVDISSDSSPSPSRATSPVPKEVNQIKTRSTRTRKIAKIDQEVKVESKKMPNEVSPKQIAPTVATITTPPPYIPSQITPPSNNNNNIISGRIINLSSGFKIPKRQR